MEREEIYDLSKKYTLFTWTKQEGYDPICVDRAEGVYFWDKDGKRYTDLTSQLVNVNLGFHNEHVIQAIKDQADQFCYVAPRHTFEARAKLGQMLIEEIAPKNMSKVLFTNGGADANEYAIRLAKVYSSKHKIFSKYQSYHGSTYGAGTLTGEEERSVPFPGVPGFVKFVAPHTYDYDIQFDSEEAACEHFLKQLEYQIRMEGKDDIAAIFIETVAGSNGAYIYPKGYLKGVRALCDKYGILMVCDEVMMGFGRCGEWFAFQAFDIEPDMVTFAKGVNSGYAPLGGVLISKKIADYFETHSLPAGLTYNSHALGIAAAIANLEEFKRLDLVNHAKEMGKILGAELERMKEKHPCVGDVRYIGLHSAIELVKNRKTHEPLTEDQNGVPILASITKNFKDRGFTLVGHDNNFCISPALIVTEEQLHEMMEGVDAVLSDYDMLAEA